MTADGTMRKIAALRLPDITPGGADMPEPVFARVMPGELLVDESYQRNLSVRSMRLIKRIVANWNWRTFMPPVVVRVAGGAYHVIDGQHTAIAAASHPAIKDIPVMVVKADAINDRAMAFLGRNRDRIAVTPNQLYAAAVVAGEPNATSIDKVCRLAGVRILKNPPGAGFFRVGETLAIGAVSALLRRRGEAKAREVLTVLTKAKLGPVPMSYILAVEELLYGENYQGQHKAGDLTTAVISSEGEAMANAKIYAAAHGVPQYRALVMVLDKEARRGRRRAA